MTAEEPRPAELARRIDALDARVAEGFRDFGIRLDRMPTNDVLLAYLATRDQEMKTNGEDIKDLTKGLADERSERMQADQRIIDQAAAAKRWIVTAGISGAVLFLGILGFVLDFGGAPA